MQLTGYTSGLIDSIYRENGKKCGVTYAKQPVSQFMPVAMMFAKNGPYTRAINERYTRYSRVTKKILINSYNIFYFQTWRLQALIEGGIIGFIMKKYMVITGHPFPHL